MVRPPPRPTLFPYTTLFRSEPFETAERAAAREQAVEQQPHHHGGKRDRKSTRLNSSHTVISYAVFCLKKKKTLAGIGFTTHTHLVAGSEYFDSVHVWELLGQ